MSYHGCCALLCLFSCLHTGDRASEGAAVWVTILMAYIQTAYIVMAYVVMAYIQTAYIVMPYVVMATHTGD